MRLGEHLIKIGICTETELLKALVYQEKKRKPLSYIALKCGYITVMQALEIFEIQQERWAAHEFEQAEFTAIALERDYLTPTQLETLHNHQQDMRPNLGECLVKIGVLRPDQLNTTWIKTLQEK